MTIYKSNEGKQVLMNRYDELLKRWPVIYQSKFIETQFGLTHILQWGKGKDTLVLLHGSTSNSSMWIGEAESFNTCNVIAIDILGEPGKSAETRLDLSSQESSQWLDEVFLELNLENVHLIGNSLGGYLALDFATRKPEKISSLTLIAPSGLANARLSFVFKSLIYLLQGEKGAKKISEIVFNGPVDKKVVDVSLEMIKYFKPRMGSLPVIKEKLKYLTMPVYYMAGKDDALLNTKKSQQALLKYTRHAKVEILDQGHVIYGKANEILNFIHDR